MLLQGWVTSVLFDDDVNHCNKGAGLHVLVDGGNAASSPTISKLAIDLKSLRDT